MPKRNLKISSLFAPLVPKKRRPIPKSSKTLAESGLSSRLTWNKYKTPARKNGLYSLGVIEYDGHAGCFIVILRTKKGVRVAFIEQWRPTDMKSLEIPAGGIGSDPNTMLNNTLEELGEEVGNLNIISIEVSPGFSHDTSRQVMKDGGPKAYFSFLIHAKGEVWKKEFKKENENTKLIWLTKKQARQAIRGRKIADMAACFFLLAAGIIKKEDIAWTKIK